MTGFPVVGLQMGLANVLILFYGLAMAIETLGQAYSAHWKVHVACEGCPLRERVDLRALLWTRGKDMPIAQLEERLKCPRCGSRKIQVSWSVPGNPKPASNDLVAIPGRYWIEKLDRRGQVVNTLKRARFDDAVKCFETEVERQPAGRFVMRDGSRIVHQWPKRGT